MIVIIDYGMGNLASVKNAFARLGYEALITNDADTIANAERVVLPGVGAFKDAISNLRNLGLDNVIREVINNKTPFLGICLGMQLLCSISEEDGEHKGLDVIPGSVKKFDLPAQYKVPHMGWNQVWLHPDSKLFRSVPTGSYFYFVHSYYVSSRQDDWIYATTDYGVDFVCAVEKDNLWATQFHPEKSGDMGLQILKNFGEM